MNKKQSPFFAKFLENQDKKAIQGGGGTRNHVTQKYPSDSDEGGIDF